MPPKTKDFAEKDATGLARKLTERAFAEAIPLAFGSQGMVTVPDRYTTEQKGQFFTVRGYRDGAIVFTHQATPADGQDADATLIGRVPSGTTIKRTYLYENGGGTVTVTVAHPGDSLP